MSFGSEESHLSDVQEAMSWERSETIAFFWFSETIIIKNASPIRFC